MLLKMVLSSPVLLTILLAAYVRTQWTSMPFNQPSLPLAVRSPYLNTWLAQGHNPSPASTIWPKTWQQSVSTSGKHIVYLLLS